MFKQSMRNWVDMLLELHGFRQSSGFDRARVYLAYNISKSRILSCLDKETSGNSYRQNVGIITMLSKPSSAAVYKTRYKLNHAIFFHPVQRLCENRRARKLNCSHKRKTWRWSDSSGTIVHRNDYISYELMWRVIITVTSVVADWATGSISQSVEQCAPDKWDLLNATTGENNPDDYWQLILPAM